MNKMVINHLDKLFVTSDAATIVNELEVQHPAAKILVLAGKAQQEEIGDGANLTISFGGELLHNAAELIRTGLHPSEIISGYTKGINKVIYLYFPSYFVDAGLQNALLIKIVHRIDDNLAIRIDKANFWPLNIIPGPFLAFEIY